MWDIHDLNRRLREASLSGESWGYRGAKAIERIERGLDVQLRGQVREFVAEIGNVRVDPFNIILAGDDEGKFSAVLASRELWRNSPDLDRAKAITLMDHAGEVYLYYPESERVCAYDALRPRIGEETLSWESFDQFLSWVFEEAQGMTRDTRF